MQYLEGKFGGIQEFQGEKGISRKLKLITYGETFEFWCNKVPIPTMEVGDEIQCGIAIESGKFHAPVVVLREVKNV